MNPRIRPRVVSRFYKGDKGKCIECEEIFPLDELALVGRSWFDGNIEAFDLYCQECFDLMTEGDEKAWKEAL